ncbi:rhomboid family intramembrane serine protease [Blattabacterium cuenoti]|uniref:rhomboid family intramembrane serine protease n=1 Tax=Blattabacterium cuenoti TaxID=1653831 RepID=UPI001EEA16C6|nr:rhomboid family intramembrane serine protease [Blattabacterium cuenoti]
MIYLSILILYPSKIEDTFSLYNPLDERFKIFQVFTHMFIHSKNILLHIILNMLGLLMFGRKMENLLGSRKLIMLYIVSGILSAFVQIIFNTGLIFYFIKNFSFEKINYSLILLSEYKRFTIYSYIYSPMMGASGAVSGILGAFAIFYPEQKIFILPFPLPIRIKKAIIIFIIISLLSSIFNLSPGIAHFAHIGGILSGYLIGNFFFQKKIKYFLI